MTDQGKPVRTRIPYIDLPPVLDTADLVNVLHLGENHVRKLVTDGELQRLAFSPHYVLVERREVLRFLRKQTKTGEAS
jgi:hypothetical protein